MKGSLPADRSWLRSKLVSRRSALIEDRHRLSSARDRAAYWAASDLIVRKTFSWTHLLNDVERHIPIGVRVLRIGVSKERSAASVAAEASGRKVVTLTMDIVAKSIADAYRNDRVVQPDWKVSRHSEMAEGLLRAFPTSSLDSKSITSRQFLRFNHKSLLRPRRQPVRVRRRQRKWQSEGKR